MFNIYINLFSKLHLNGVILTEIKISSFCATKNLAGREPPYRARKPGEVLCSCEPGQRRL
jgi:hypothetical protein